MKWEEMERWQLGQIASKIEHDTPLIVISMWTLRGWSLCDGGGNRTECGTRLKEKRRLTSKCTSQAGVFPAPCISVADISQPLAF